MRVFLSENRRQTINEFSRAVHNTCNCPDGREYKTVIKKIVLSVVIFFVSLLLFLLATLPANFVWQRFVEPQLPLQKTGISVLAVDGSIWDGRAQIRYQQLDMIADWNVSLPDIATLSVPMELTLESHAGIARFSVLFGVSESRIELSSADIDLAYLTPVLKRQRVELSGNLMAKELAFNVVDQRIVSAEGLFSWSGGEISYPAGAQIHQRDMPSFRGQVELLDDGVIYMGIRDNQASFDLIEGSLQTDGTALMKIKRRLLDLADERWPRNSQEQDVVFKVKKMIY